MTVRLDALCRKASSNVAQKDLEQRDGAYPIFGAGGLIKYVDFYQQERPYIAVVKDGAGVGRVMRLPGKSSVIGTMQYILPNEGVSVSYLAYAMEHLDLARHCTGATIPHIYFRDYGRETLRSHSPEEQRRIAAVLDQAVGLAVLRRRQLDKLDELIRARFFEMFGDPIANSKNLPVKRLVDVVTLQRGYDLPVQNRNADGSIPVYGSNGILGHHGEAKSSNGVVTGRSGTIGRVDYCKGPFWPLNTTLFSVEPYGNDIVYLSYLLSYFGLERFHDGTGVPTLNRNVIHKEKIIDVPVSRQAVFSSFVRQIEQLKLSIRQSLAQLETLKKSLMQQYFG